MATIFDLAKSYHDAIHAHDHSAVSGEPEAQLTTPVSNLFCGLISAVGSGKLSLIRESRLDRTRPDFAALYSVNGKTYQKGYVELKAPQVTVDVSLWRGRNARQWESMKSEAEILIVCNGSEARLYRNGEQIGDEATLPYRQSDKWDASGLSILLNRFLEINPTPVTSVRDLSTRLAVRTADLRDRLLWLMDQSSPAAEAAKGGYASWKQHVHPDATERSFADSISQVVAYGMVLAALSQVGVDADNDGHVTVAEARKAIRSFSPIMAAAFAPLVDKPLLFNAVCVELGALETLISAIDAERVNKSADRRGEPWLYFYEDFLSIYDAEERKQAGVYYTPVDVVRAMVNIVDHIIVERFGLRLGFADPSVVTLDPATGTGTFPLAVIDRAVARAEHLRGSAGKSQAANNLAKSLLAFELLPGPYSVAHLRLTQRLQELNSSLDEGARVVLTDTLESPLNPREQISLFGDAEVLAAEQNRAKRIKLEKKVTVVMGNPPYRRVERETAGRGSGGWVVEGKVPGRKGSNSLFDDILDVAKKHTVFSHHASLYNLYVYFWRWAIWKAFEAHGDGPGVVAFITASSWLKGPGFVGLRQLVRETCDEAWIIDLGGDNKGAHPEENIFAIETPVSVAILVRIGKKDRKSPAKINYRRVSGSAAEKLAAMASIATARNPLEGNWLSSPQGWMDPITPSTGDADWHSMVLLKNIFPWQQPGCKFGRTWPIAPSREILERRWEQFTAAPVDSKPTLFMTANSGRNATTKVGDLRRLIDLQKGDPSEPIVRYGYRSFDRQWTFDDPRMAKTESPSLWFTSSKKQIYLCTLMTGSISYGPSLTVSAYVPDLHYFRGSFGGKDIIPIYRDKAARIPNLTEGFGAVVAKKIGMAEPNVEEIASYVYALLVSTKFYETFREALKTPGIRVPITRSESLWKKAVDLGSYLLWIHTYAERFRDPNVSRGVFIPTLDGIGWEKSISKMPIDRSEIKYDSDSLSLYVGDGLIKGISPLVWDYSVSGMKVIDKWLGYRTVRGTGRAMSSSSDLDKVRPSSWSDDWNDELLDLIRIITLTIEKQLELNSLVDDICDGELIAASDFPAPKDAERAVPLEEKASLFE